MISLPAPPRFLASLLPAALAVLAAMTAGAEDPFTIYTTPQGTYRLESFGNDNPPVFVSTKGAAQRTPLPGAEWTDPDECTIIHGGSPDEQWIYRTESWRHHAVQGRTLFQHQGNAKFAPFKDEDWFTQAAIAFAGKNLGIKKTDFATQRGTSTYDDHLRADFHGWSGDSSRLLVRISGEGGTWDGSPKRYYVYFNTRTKVFELTPYLRALNRKTNRDDAGTITPCPEPIDPLPTLEKLQARYEKLNHELEDYFANALAHPKRKDLEEWQTIQRETYAAREAGLQFYLQFAPKKDLEARRVQYLADATFAVLEETRDVLP